MVRVSLEYEASVVMSNVGGRGDRRGACDFATRGCKYRAAAPVAIAGLGSLFLELK